MSKYFFNKKLKTENKTNILYILFIAKFLIKRTMYNLLRYYQRNEFTLKMR